ncbi:MAG: GNAT family N-acetyltransferase [bacterium]|nr:GNAT family N-acetyltransferase [bacterium]
MGATPATYASGGILRDGTAVVVRAIRPEDRAGLAEQFARLSPQSVYFRFFRVKTRLTDDELTAFTQLDFVRHVALVATLHQDGVEQLLGVARYAIVDERLTPPHRAEVAFVVMDDWQGKGIGTLLLEHLVPLARAGGVTEFEANVLGDNNRMLKMFASSGFRVRRSLDAGVFQLSFPTAETPEHQRIQTERDREAAARSLDAVLHPRAVAVVGASDRPDSLGGAVLRNLVRGGFTGTIHPVHPHAATVGDLPAVRTVSAIGTPVDLVVVAVPAEAVLEVAEDAARAGAHALVVLSAGFADAGPEGAARERDLVTLARRAGMRLVGPNCMGVLNTDPTVALHATFAPTLPPAGHVAILSQSGTLGLAILEHARNVGLGLSSFVSLGNKADVSGNDLLAHWAEDERTHVVLLYLEAFGNPRRFARLAPLVARRKPVVAVKSGRTAAPRRATQSHSGALASLDVAVDALFAHAGVLRTDTLEGMFDVATLLATQPVPPGLRVGVVTNAGAPATLLADACIARGLTLPALAAETAAALPAGVAAANPVDLRPTAVPDAYRQATLAVGRDPGVDAVVVVYVPALVTHPAEAAAAIAVAAGEMPAEKPVLTVFLSARGAPALLGTGPRRAIPAYDFPENAAAALAAAAQYGAWRRRPPGSAHVLDDFARDAVRAVVERALDTAGGATWLDADDIATILRAVGIDHAETVVVAPRDARAAAARLGFPLVLKAVAPGLLRKSDAGAVLRDIGDAAAVAPAVDLLRDRVARAGTTLEAVVLQRQVPGGIEALVGVTSDPTFGPLVVCGLGGVLVELLRDVAFCVPPVTDRDAEEMLARLRAAPLLDGYRGAPPGDRAALAQIVLRISALVDVVPELRELDLNPVKVLEPGRGAIVVDARMRIGPL